MMIILILNRAMIILTVWGVGEMCHSYLKSLILHKYNQIYHD